ncbi:ectoine/hydroxyectoine ABC transporter permease subunit EhuC [Prauserella flavalba]|uniref:ectoine/hydroxyectoine ABC transporter permease subunit EhuC n=1 Tax=Prauserella flavalba TaxID=1477506 RepID=UPI0036EE6C32
MNINEIWEIAKLLFTGLKITVELTVISGVLCVGVAVVAGIARLSPRKTVRSLAGIFVEFFRGTNVIVQLFWAFYALPLLGVYMAPMTAAIMVLALNAGAYGAEVVRGAIKAVPHGQREAATALNMTPMTTVARVILPQAVPAMIPPFTNLLIELLKSTPLVSLITIADMTFIGDTIRSRTGDSETVFLVLFVLYFFLASAISILGRFAERIPKYRRVTVDSSKQSRPGQKLEVMP